MLSNFNVSLLRDETRPWRPCWIAGGRSMTLGIDSTLLSPEQP